MKICTRVRLKPSNDRGEFELDRTRIKNNIAENSVALGHDTHNTFKPFQDMATKLEIGAPSYVSDQIDQLVPREGRASLRILDVGAGTGLLGQKVTHDSNNNVCRHLRKGALWKNNMRHLIRVYNILHS